jgi:glycerol-3-phosphate dehydrogenase
VSYDYDVIIIGAGVNGAGIARDAALRGLRVLLLDKGDFASGTSGWSTRLIHGGLRYLEYGEIGLVRESLREREVLLRIAPHLVKPLPMVVPLYGEPNRRPKWMIRAGMLAYDALSFDKSLARHQFWSDAETLRRASGLRVENLKGAAVYYDAQVEYPERLTLENVLDAQARGADVRSYARVTRLINENGAAQGVEYADAEGEHAARAPVVFNVAGPWVDQLLRNQNHSPLTIHHSPLIGGTKGSHIVVKPFAGTPDGAVYVEAKSDRRPFFIIPWQGLCLIGTTDLPFDGDLDNVSATESEINYLLDETNWLFPAANLNRASVLFTYSGVRPLPYVAADKPAGITRRHFIHNHAPAARGLLSVVGGKLTTYRSLAAEATDEIFRQLGRPAPPCATGETPLPGAGAGSREQEVGERLRRVYGAEAARVLALAREDAALNEVFDEFTGAIAAEVVHAVRHEAAQNLRDILLRRAMVGYNEHAGLGADEAAARVAQQHLGWTPERAAQEVTDYRAYVARFHPRRAVALEG